MVRAIMVDSILKIEWCCAERGSKVMFDFEELREKRDGRRKDNLLMDWNLKHIKTASF